MKIPIFPEKYHQNGGFSMAMLVSGRVYEIYVCTVYLYIFIYIYMYIYGRWMVHVHIGGCRTLAHMYVWVAMNHLDGFLSFFTMELPKLHKKLTSDWRKLFQSKHDSETSRCLPIEISIYPLENMCVFYQSIGWLFESFTVRNGVIFPFQSTCCPWMCVAPYMEWFSCKMEFCLDPNMYGKKGVVFSPFPSHCFRGLKRLGSVPSARAISIVW